MASKSYIFYADESSRAVLANDKEKIILVGSDFGYGGNFGDILQLKNVVHNAQATGRYHTVAVMTASAIGSTDIPRLFRDFYGVDAILFLSETELDLRGTGLPLSVVEQIRNPSVLHLYGGGFLNPMWGYFVLGVIEFLLETLRCPTYLISGQQVTRPFQHEVAQHILRYRPQLFGVRDEPSLAAMMEVGISPAFSFDDATEALQQFSADLPLRRGNGAILHLNISGYTGNDADFHRLTGDLVALHAHPSTHKNLTLVQAYNDRRPEVCDTVEAIKTLEHHFPYGDARLLILPSLLYGGPSRYNHAVEAEFGISCSYHVALWLQLAGIPCWLRHNNDFYSQKAQALQVTQTFEEFLAAPSLANHSTNLERRMAWQQKLHEHLDAAPCHSAQFQMQGSSSETPLPFRLRGWPSHTPQELLTIAHAKHACLEEQIQSLQTSLAAMEHTGKELESQVEAITKERDDLSREYLAVVASRSWRTAQRLRMISILARKPINMLRRLF